MWPRIRFKTFTLELKQYFTGVIYYPDCQRNLTEHVHNFVVNIMPADVKRHMHAHYLLKSGTISLSDWQFKGQDTVMIK